MSGRPFVPVIHGAAADRPDEADTRAAAEAVAQALADIGCATEIMHLDFDLGVLEALGRRRPDAVFNLVEALRGDCALALMVPLMLDNLGLRYTGAGAAAWATTLSKTGTKRHLAAAGLPTPAWVEAGTANRLPGRVIVKSDTEHASLGIDAASVTSGAGAAAEIGRRERRHGGRFFAESFIEGREFNLSLIEEAGSPRVLPPAEIEFIDFPPERPHIVDYEAKWLAGSFAYDHTPRRFDFPATDHPLLERLCALALECWTLFGLTGYARVDFRVDGAGQPWILEVNLNPCLTPDAGFFAAASRAGLDYPAMVRLILDAALAARRQAA
ncbi:MAG: D-alanine--D-alanine ligase [Alphaproteobacteria bacterium]|nr:D-alanine--D-alanine ligase [Alphaproteobacteria bacterium]